MFRNLQGTGGIWSLGAESVIKFKKRGGEKEAPLISAWTLKPKVSSIQCRFE